MSKEDPKEAEHRAGEAPRSRFRSSDRSFQMNGAWYFGTREGINIGPYPTKAACDYAVLRFTAIMRGIQNRTLIDLLIQDFMPREDPWPGAKRHGK